MIVACQKCGEAKVIAGSPDSNGLARAVWTCSKCGAGQVMELAVSKDARRGDLRRIIGGLALVKNVTEKPALHVGGFGSGGISAGEDDE